MVKLHRGTGSLFLFLLAWFLSPVTAALVNRTIDDTFGDSTTGVKVIYSPQDDSTWKDQTCVGCAIRPPTAKAFRGTYTAATYNPDIKDFSITMDFTGTAIYVFFILANDEGDGITTLTESNFTIDGGRPTLFRHVPDLSTTEVLFNQLVFSQTKLTNTKHRLVISTSGVNENVFVSFDSATYTFDDTPVVSTTTTTATSSSTTTSSRPTSSTTKGTNTSTTSGQTTSSSLGPSPSGNPGGSQGQENQTSASPKVAIIVGLVLGGIAIIILFILGFICYRRRRRSQQRGERMDIDPPSAPVGSSEHQATAITPFTTQYNSQPVAGPSNYYQNYANAYNPATSRSKYSLASGTLPAQYQASTAASDNQSAYGGVADSAYSAHGQAAVQVGASMYQREGPRPRLISVTNGDHISSPDTSHYGAASNTSLINAYASSQATTASREDIRRQRQQELDEQLRTVQEEINFLTSDISGQKPGRHQSIRRQRTQNRGHPQQGDGVRNIASEDGAEDEDMSMEEMREQLRTMKNQISHLREQQRSAWAQGLSDDPPPGYSPAITGSRATSMRYSTDNSQPVPPLPPLPAKSAVGAN